MTRHYGATRWIQLNSLVKPLAGALHLHLSMMRTTLVAIALAATGCMVGADPGSGAEGGGGAGPGYGGGGEGGSGGGGGGGGGSGTSTPAQVMTKMDHAECDQAFACKASFPTDQGVTFEQAFGTSATDCYAKLGAFYDAASVEASISAGKIRFDAAAGAECVAAAPPAPNCTDLWQNGPQFPNACFDALSGKVADGAACTNDFECAETSYCDQTSKKCTLAQ